MIDITRNDLEIAPKSTVMQTAREFAETLGGTQQYQEFEQSYSDYRQDAKALKALQEFKKKQSSLKALIMLNAVSDEDRLELQRLQDEFNNQSTVLRYTKAQDELVSICQEIGDQLSRAVGLDYASSCRTGGCCG